LHYEIVIIDQGYTTGRGWCPTQHKKVECGVQRNQGSVDALTTGVKQMKVILEGTETQSYRSVGRTFSTVRNYIHIHKMA